MKHIPGDLPAAISRAVGTCLSPMPAATVSGGCIHDCYRWESESGPLFVKLASTDRLDMLQAEAAGLDALAATDTLRVPAVHGSGLAGVTSWLALEWLDLEPNTARSEARAGEQLAALHGHSADGFGWRRDNYIGLTPQSNAWRDDWCSFFADRRLRPQLERARDQGHAGAWLDRAEVLLLYLPDFFRGRPTTPSLLHGDLWAGNMAACAGEPVIFDPAVYYGDRETDLAMTRLFGGFGPSFYQAYDFIWSPSAGASQRLSLYNLYHILNHLNLFGAAYLRRAQQLIDQLLSERAA